METLRELRFDHSYTQKMLADAAGVSRHAVLRMEQHVYPSPLPQIINALSEITGYDHTELELQYKKEIVANRREHGEIWGLKGVGYSIFEYDVGSLHPFVGFRERLAKWAEQPTSQIQFCIAFSIHPYTLSEYEEYKSKYPESIRSALTESGLPASITYELVNQAAFNIVSD